MASSHEEFWSRRSFAVVGHSAERKFPVLTYRGLKRLGKTVCAVDPTASEVDGDAAHSDLDAVPHEIDAVVIEVPSKRTAEWVARAAARGVRDVWIHRQTDTPEALALATEKGLNVRTGACAVMYLDPGLSLHGVHRWIAKRMGRY